MTYLTPIPRASRVAAVVSLLVAVGPAPAVAGTATMTSEGRFAYDAARGERNSVLLRMVTSPGSGEAWLIRDGAGVTAAAGCLSVAATAARCPIPTGTAPLRPVVRAGDKSDRVQAGFGTHILGGAGNDTLRVRDGRIRVNPGPGRDTVDFLGSRAGSPPTVLIEARDGESDWIECGHGRDTVVLDYADEPCDRIRRRGAARAVVTRPGAFAEDIEPGLVTVSQIGCPSDFGPSPCRVWFTISQPGGVSLDTLGIEKLAPGEFGHREALIERSVFAFDLTRVNQGWHARVTLMLHSRDARGRAYTLRRWVTLSVTEATCEC